MEKITVADIAKLIEGTVVGEEDRVIAGVASLADASGSDLSFYADRQFKKDFESTQAGAVIVSREITESSATLIQVESPGHAFDRLIETWFEGPEIPEPQIHPTAVVDSSSQIHPEAFVGPYVVIGKNCHVGQGSVLYSHVTLSENVAVGEQTIVWPFVCIREGSVLGDRCLIHPGTIIGFDGFGFNHEEGHWKKIPQRGTVVIGHDVEIGANVTIARARFGQTRIGNGTKIDADTQVGHNVQIGEHVYVAAMTGFGGTSQVGDFSVVGPQSGFAPHVKVTAGSMIAARTGVLKDIAQKGVYSGFPARPHSEEKRRYAATWRIQELQKEVMELRDRLEKLEQPKND